MSNWFEMFPEIKYDGVLTKDATRRVILKDSYESNPLIFLPYTIKNGQRADQVAKAYYGDVSFTWLVWLSNKVIDPYYDWPLFGIDFDRYLMKKYAVRSGSIGMDIVNWTMMETTNDNIVRYERKDDPSVHASIDSKGAPWFVSEEWKAVRIYDDEYQRNEDRRNIHLVDVTYVPTLVKRIGEVLK